MKPFVAQAFGLWYFFAARLKTNGSRWFQSTRLQAFCILSSLWFIV